jgi:hypothetical protein
MKRLIALPFRKSIEIAFQSIRVRFFRSLVTTTSLVLAVAFLCFMRSCNDFAQALLNSGDVNAYQALIQAGFDVGYGTEVISASAKQRWIVTLSLLVCIVGIINAQLMSVTERFREIGTMKCLGALDRFIVRIFVLEALMQGVVGSLAGSVIGVVAALISSLFNLGSGVFAVFPWQALAFSMLVSIVIGTGLSLAGVIYPAIIAARMQPVEAMRLEQ